MKTTNLFAIFLLLILILTTANALFYTTDGAWSQYTSGLSSDFYKIDLQQTTYDRSFEGFGAGSLNDTETTNWKIDYSATGSAIIGEADRSSTNKHEGTYSLRIIDDRSSGTNTHYVIAQVETLGDVNVTFWLKGTTTNLDVGYVNDFTGYDANGFVGVASFNSLNYADFTQLSFYLPAGKKRIAFKFYTAGASFQAFIDDIKIIKNNTGTFRTTDPQFCNSVSSCSNIVDHLPASNLGRLWYIVDYVAGATCLYSINGTPTGTLTEGSNGMYYTELNLPVLSSDYRDANVSATCNKIPFATKSYFASPTLYKYGLVDDGSFENVAKTELAGTCTNDWCFTQTGASIIEGTIHGASDTIKDGQQSLKILCSTNGTCEHTVYSVAQVVADSNVTFFAKGTDKLLNLGYFDDTNTFHSVRTIADASYSNWTRITYAVPSGFSRIAIRSTLSAGQSHNLYIDSITSTGIAQATTIVGANDLTSNQGILDTYTFTTDYKSTAGATLSSASCVLFVDSVANAMTYNSGLGKFALNYTFSELGVHSIKHSCSFDGYNDGNTSYNVTIATPASQILLFTPIQNVDTYNSSDFSPRIDFSSTNSIDNIIFSVINASSAYPVTFYFNDYTNKPNKQFSIYTSTNGTTWTFNDSLTFGSSTSYNDPIQKIPILNGHSYSFTDTLSNAQKKYYKIVLNTLPASWETIENNSNWINVNQPSVYKDTNGKNWDVFADSNYTPIKSYTSKKYPDLTSTDLNTGFELQFTGYADKTTTIKVGYTIDGVNTTLTVPLTTTKTRFSVPVDPTSNEARLLITSDGNNATIYLTDYAIVPKAYFTSRLEVFQNDGSPLNAIINNGTSKIYIREAIPFIIQTSAYDKDGDLARLSVQAMIGSVVIKTKEFSLSEATKVDKVFTWDELIEGFIDLNGNAVSPATLRDISIKATLYNSANQSVSEQTAVYKILQYPYFESDIQFSIYSLNAKVGENPSVRLNLNQKDPTQLIGVKIFIYDINHSLANPNYSETILNTDLGCTTFICSKDLLIDSYVFEAQTQYKIAVQLKLKTETDSLTNPLTLKIFNQQVTFNNFETARIFQVGERTDHTYTNTEPIQLVLQLRDVPYKDLSADTSVYLTLDTCNADTGSCLTTGTTKFYPKKFIYDKTTGYNYYFFDQLFYTDAGTLLPDGNYIRFSAKITDQKKTHDLATLPTATLADKCNADYGSLFNPDWFNMNYWNSILSSAERALYGCGTLSSAIVETGDAEEKRLLIDADHNVTGGQNQSIACLKLDNTNFQNTLEQDLICGVLWNKNEQNIDKFIFMIGNEFSDYSKTGNNAEYLTFQIPAEQLMFSDSLMLQQALNTEYSTDSIDTVGEIFFYGLDKLFSGYANPLTDILEGTTKTGLITNVGFDINWSNQLDPQYVKGIFFFKVKGLKVINQYDYINQYPELENTNPKFFREFANQKKLKLPIQSTLVNVYSNDLTNWSLVGDQLDSLEVVSPLVIYQKPSYSQTTLDSNAKLVATKLKFDLTSDMISNNQTAVQRLFLPLTFSYTVPERALSFGGIAEDILYGKDSSGKPAGLLTNPVGFGFKNWFWFLLAVVGLLILSLIVRNFRTNGGGGFNIPVVTPFLEGRNKFARKGR